MTYLFSSGTTITNEVEVKNDVGNTIPITVYHSGNVVATTNRFPVDSTGTITVDGFNPDGKIVYEYNGCYFHGCESCYNRYTQNCINMKYMKDLNNDWEKQKKSLTDNDYVESQALHGDDEYLLLQFDSSATSRIYLEQEI